LSAAKAITGSLGLSSNSISATWGPQPADVAGKGVLQQILPGAVELQLLGDLLRDLAEQLPREAVDVRAVFSLRVGHQKGDVVADVVDEVVDYESLSLGLSKLGGGVLEHLGVDLCVAGPAADVGLYDRYGYPHGIRLLPL
jgi:hypothetical protein